MNTEIRPASYPLRLEHETRAKLEAIAKASGRSLNTQIAMMLEAALQSGGNHQCNSDAEKSDEGRMRQIAREVALELIREELTRAHN